MGLASAALSRQNGVAARHDLSHESGVGDQIRVKASFRNMNEQELQKRAKLLRWEHRDLDAAILALTDAGSSDQLQIARLKKRKLRLKDQLSSIEDTLLPDIIA